MHYIQLKAFVLFHKVTLESVRKKQNSNDSKALKGKLSNGTIFVSRFEMFPCCNTPDSD